MANKVTRSEVYPTIYENTKVHGYGEIVQHLARRALGDIIANSRIDPTAAVKDGGPFSITYTVTVVVSELIGTHYQRVDVTVAETGIS